MSFGQEDFYKGDPHYGNVTGWVIPPDTDPATAEAMAKMALNVHDEYWRSQGSSQKTTSGKGRGVSSKGGGGKKTGRGR